MKMPNESQSGTDLLMKVMEKFQHGEPEAMLIVWTDENRDICIVTNCQNSHALGLSEWSRKYILKEMLGPEA